MSLCVVFSRVWDEFLQTCLRCYLTDRQTDRAAAAAAAALDSAFNFQQQVNAQTAKWDDNTPAPTAPTRPVRPPSCTRQMSRENEEKKKKKKNRKKTPTHLEQDLLRRTTKQAVAWRKGGEKVTRVALNKHNEPAEERARSSACWYQGFQLTKQV